ncbi:MAG: DHH family phosphoesterase [Chloroflexota bacterium]|nr:DHH family phosphoesterase [Chloroflexota bacterium]
MTWKIDPDEAAAARGRLHGARTVLMPTHQNVDADGLSSPIAMRQALAQVGVDAYPLVTDTEIPSSLKFLPDIDAVLVYGRDPLPDYDLICMIDCADRRRLGRFSKDEADKLDGSFPIVNIDHHVTNDRFGAVNIVIPDAAAAAEIVTGLLRAWGTEITPPIAQSLLAGLYGDTLGLRTPSTTSQTIRTVADLVDAGGDLMPVVDCLFRLKPRSTVCLWEHGLSNVSWAGEIIWTELTRAGFRDCGAAMDEAEGFVNFLAGTQGSRIAVILYQDEDERGWRVSMRSLETEVDVSAIAADFGGGGHPRAAGMHLDGHTRADIDAFLRRVAELLEAPPRPSPARAAVVHAGR